MYCNEWREKQEFLEQKKKMEEEARLERERHEKERLLALKNKEKREQSAVASSEVKQKLQVCLARSATLFFFFKGEITSLTCRMARITVFLSSSSLSRSFRLL